MQFRRENPNSFGISLHTKHDPIEKRKGKKNLHFLFNGTGGTLPLLAPEKVPLNDMRIKENKSKQIKNVLTS